MLGVAQEVAQGGACFSMNPCMGVADRTGEEGRGV